MPLFQINDGSIKEFSDHEIPEERLRTLFENNGLIFIERGLRFVDRNVPAGNGFIDTLAIDDANRPVVIEYKVKEGVSGEALTQALSYASFLSETPERFAKLIKSKLTNINPEDIDFDNMRIVIVAPEFSYHAINAINQIEPSAKLIKYKIFKSEGVESLMTEIISDSSNTRISPVFANYNVEDNFHGRYVSMKPVFDKLQTEIKKQFGVTPYAKKFYIAFKRNYIFVEVEVYLDKIVVALATPESQKLPTPPFVFDSDSSKFFYYIYLSKPEDVGEELMRWIKVAYDNS